jgi:aspartate/methionine/tyrosine aminotransferase
MAGDAFPTFDYLHFARFGMHGAAHELCMSGVPEFPPEELGSAPPELRQALTGELWSRWGELVSDRWGLRPDQLLPCLGSSGGVFLAVTACVTLARERAAWDPAVAIERPAYGVFESAARLIGAPMMHFERRREDGYALNPDRVAESLRAGARVVCLTNLHNPSCVALAADALEALRRLAHEHDAYVILDEVYRDFLPGDVGSDFAPEERVVCVSSLTKCYGVGGGRIGWLAGPPEVIERADHVVEITHGVDPIPVRDVAVRALERADDLLARGREIARRGRRVMDAWIDATPGVTWVPPAAGITGLVHVEGLSDSFDLARRLRSDLDVQVVPGGFFGADDALRVSFGLPPARLQRALETLALGLGALLR